MAVEVINGILKVKRGDEYVILNPRTVVGQVDGITDATISLFNPYVATREQFTTTNPVITKGRLAIESDKGGMKIGDGTTRWNSLSYVKVDLQQIVDLMNTIDEKIAVIRKTRAQFNSENPETTSNKFYVESDKGGIKIGDGTTRWSALPYVGGLQESEIVDLFNPIRSTRSGFTTSDKVVPKGVFAIETDKGGIKLGDGSTKWTDLPYLKIDTDMLVDFGTKVMNAVAPIQKTYAELNADATITEKDRVYIDTTNNTIKIGDGSRRWSNLPYVGGTEKSEIINLFTPDQRTRAQFTSANPVISKGRLAIETDKGGIKIGDGTTKWSSLPYVKVDIGQIDNFNSTVNEAVAPVKKTRAEFTSQNPITANNKFYIETDKGGIKIGDGSTRWNDLGYIGGTNEETAASNGDALFIKTRLDDGTYARVTGSTTGDTIYIKLRQSNGTYVRIS